MKPFGARIMTVFVASPVAPADCCLGARQHCGGRPDQSIGGAAPLRSRRNVPSNCFG